MNQGLDRFRREDVVEAIVETLRGMNHVHAVWEAGAASFNRVDQWSDIDLNIVVDDACVENTLKAIEERASALAGIAAKFRMPEPSWHGHSQLFLQLKQASPYVFLDIVVMKQSSKDKFLQFSIHGRPLVHFDKAGIVKDDPLEADGFIKKLAGRIEALKSTFPMFQVLTLKELNRGNDIEALGYYLGYTFRPLVELLRIKHCPVRFNFHTSYLHYDLPSEVVDLLQRFAFIRSASELGERRAEAEAWFWEVAGTINLDDVRRKIESPLMQA